MSKKPIENKEMLPVEDKGKGKKKVQIRLRPGRGIGGIGTPGSVAWVTAAEATYWVGEGYADLVDDQPVVVDSVVDPDPEDAGDEEE